MKDNRHSYLFKESVLFWFEVLLESWKWLQSCVKLPFLSQEIIFAQNISHWKIIILQPYTSWIYLDLNLYFVYCMWNYPVTREWDQVDWLVLFIWILKHTLIFWTILNSLNLCCQLLTKQKYNLIKIMAKTIWNLFKILTHLKQPKTLSTSLANFCYFISFNNFWLILKKWKVWNSS